MYPDHDKVEKYEVIDALSYKFISSVFDLFMDARVA
jgi:hypothetical protein